MNASARATHIGPGVCWDHVRIDVEGYEGFGAARKLIYAHWIHARGLRADVVQDTQQVVHLLRARLAAAALSVRLSAPQRGKHANLYANPTLADIAYLLFFLDYTASGENTQTCMLTPRWPTSRIFSSFSIIRTGMPFLRSVSAATRPAGPAPTYIIIGHDQRFIHNNRIFVLTTKTGIMPLDML